MYLKRLFIIFVYCGLLICAGNVMNKDRLESQNNIDTVQQIMQGAEVKIDKIELQVWGQINEESKYTEDRHGYNYIKSELGVSQKCAIVRKEKEKFKSISFVDKNKHEALKITFEENMIQTENNKDCKKSYLGIQYSTDNVEMARKFKEKLEKVIIYAGVKEQIGTTCVGNIPGDISRQKMKQIIENTRLKLRGKKVEEIIEDEYASISYFTSKIENVIMVNGNAINYNLAFTYNEEKDITHYIVGIPLIYQEY